MSATINETLKSKCDITCTEVWENKKSKDHGALNENYYYKICEGEENVSNERLARNMLPSDNLNISPAREIIYLLDKMYIIVMRREKFCDIYKYCEFLGLGNKLPDDEILVQLYYFIKAYKVLKEKGLYHRDVKTENIAVNKFFEFTIIDFDSCKIRKDCKIESYNGLTVVYLPPECFNLKEGQLYNDSTEMWSLITTLAEIQKGLASKSFLFEKLDKIDLKDKKNVEECLTFQQETIEKFIGKDGEYGDGLPLYEIFQGGFENDFNKRLTLEDLLNMNFFKIGLYSVSDVEATMKKYKKIMNEIIFKNIGECTKLLEKKKSNSKSQQNINKILRNLYEIGIHSGLIYRRKLFLTKAPKSLRAENLKEMEVVGYLLSEYHAELEKIHSLTHEPKQSEPTNTASQHPSIPSGSTAPKEQNSQSNILRLNLLHTALQSMCTELENLNDSSQQLKPSEKKAFNDIIAYSLIDIVDCEEESQKFENIINNIKKKYKIIDEKKK